METGAPQLEALDPQGFGLRVVFTRHGDRWQHAIERVQEGQGQTALQSIEGDSNDEWPTSPPFQELSQETLPDGRTVLFLVGRAGTSHWSASVESALDPPSLLFDIACRHSQLPQQLGSAYQSLTSNLKVEATIGQALQTVVTPTQITSRLPGTTRWQYRLTMA